MTSNRFVRAPLRTTLVAALVTAIVVAFTMFVQGGGAARVADERPSASVSPRIVGGTEVPDGKYPFMALLVFKTTQGEGDCDGSLIDPDSVLTAAHCFSLPGKPKSLQVYVGRTVRSSNQGQVRLSKTVTIHPDYNSRLGTYDAAVVKLIRPVSGIAPIDLATSKQNDLEKPGRNATVAGWGNTIAGPPGAEPPGGGEFPDRMHEAQVPIVLPQPATVALRPG